MKLDRHMGPALGILPVVSQSNFESLNVTNECN